MYYYKKNIGDYHKKAGRLSILQHGVYTLLIDACYDREQFPTLEEAIDWVWASTKEEVEALEFVLKKFFTLSDEGVYEQNRIKQEVEEYQALCLANAVNGKKGGRPKNNTEIKAEETQPVINETEPVNLQSEPKANESLNHKPLTTNHKPKIKTLDRFEDWWLVYPKKSNKKKTKEIWKRRKLDSMADTLILDVQNRLAKDRQWLDGFIPHPTTYLNGDRWDDAVTGPVSNRGSPAVHGNFESGNFKTVEAGKW